LKSAWLNTTLKFTPPEPNVDRLREQYNIADAMVMADAASDVNERRTVQTIGTYAN